MLKITRQTAAAWWLCLVVVVMTISGSVCGTSFAQTIGAPPVPEDGLWLSQDHDGVFQIGHCGKELCGRLIGMKYQGDPPKDVWGRPQCGLMMLTDFKPADDGRWVGHILDPESGHVYDARIWSPEQNVLKLRGFVLGISLFGETQTWTRYSGTIGAACMMP